MSKILLLAVLQQVFANLISYTFADDKPILERIEWSDIWVVNANEDHLPRVLLVGDSIARAYFGVVEKALDGKANCARYATSKFVGAPSYLAELEILLKIYKFDVIHINNGLHGFGYTEEQYKASFPKLLETLKKYAGGASLIWAATTPVRKSGNLSQLNEERTARVKERNRIAVAFMKEHDIPVNDLYALVKHHPEFYGNDGTHFNNEGIAAQGKQVADIVLQYLPNQEAK